MPTTAAGGRRCAHTPSRRPFICGHRSYIRGTLKRERERESARERKTYKFARGVTNTFIHRCYIFESHTHICICGYPHTHAIINVNRYLGCAIASCPLSLALLLLPPPPPLPPAQATGMRAVEAVAAIIKAMIESGRRLRRRWGWFYGHTAMWCAPGVYCLT